METMVIQLVIEIFGFATYNYTIIVMGKFHPPAFIEPFSLFWWQCIIMVILIITIVVRAPLHFKKIEPKTYANFIALFFGINYIVENYYVYSTGTMRIVEYYSNIDLYKIKANWGQGNMILNN